MKTNQTYEDEIEIDLKELFFVLLHKIWVILLAMLVCAGIAGIWTKTMITPQFQSTSMLYILSQSTSITSLADVQLGTQLTKDYQVMINSRPVLETVIENLDLNLTYEGLKSKISISNPADTRIVYITVTDPSPTIAKAITDEIASVSVVKIADIMKTDEPSIAEKGHVPEVKSSPNTTKNCLMAGLLGAALAAGVIIVLFLMDDSIRSADDIEKFLGLTTLGTIPFEEPAGSRKKKWFSGKKK